MQTILVNVSHNKKHAWSSYRDRPNLFKLALICSCTRGGRREASPSNSLASFTNNSNLIPCITTMVPLHGYHAKHIYLTMDNAKHVCLAHIPTSP